MDINLREQPWKEDPDYQRLTPHQKLHVDNILTGIAVMYIGGRQSGRTTMYHVIFEWLDKIEANSPTGENPYLKE